MIPASLSAVSRSHIIWVVLVVIILGGAGFAFLQDSGEAIPVLGYEVVAEYPHDPKAFCQGLEYHQGFVYEGTGRRGESNIRRYDLDTGEIKNKYNLKSKYFGEGITVWKDRLIQITWKSKIAFVYDKNTFDKIGEFPYQGEGWGLTHNDKHLIMSHGSSTLSFLNPDTFKIEKTITVTASDEEVHKLNELEWIQGEIYANIWQDNRIARIDPESGKVQAWINLEGIRKDSYDPSDEVLNGIAYDEAQNRLLVTGKYWPTLYHIRLKPLKDS